jgi:hypothetical protein
MRVIRTGKDLDVRDSDLRRGKRPATVGYHVLTRCLGIDCCPTMFNGQGNVQMSSIALYVLLYQLSQLVSLWVYKRLG